MVAELYLIAESFVFNNNYSKEEIEIKTKSLAQDFVCIKRYADTNKIFVHPNIYYVNFLENLSLSDLLFNPKIGKEKIDRDVYNALQKIIVESTTTDHNSEDILRILPNHTESICYGLLAFHPLEGLDLSYQIVYNLQGWYEFRRYYLGVYPKNADFYIEECIKYFPKLFFHPRNKISVKPILSDCPKKIVYHLTALNDEFNSIDKTNLNRTQVLETFSREAQLDEIASLEGHAARKEDFTFIFMNNKGQDESVCCEPHLKLCFSDTNTSYSNDRRIYFHEGVENISDGKILIGHIGNHL